MTNGRTRADARRRGGFTLLEVLVVMGLMAILLGIGAGFLQNLGTSSRTEQARSIIRETIYACKQSSNGGTKAIFDLREDPRHDDGRLLVGAAVARPVLTHNFESLDSTSSGYVLDVEGEVEEETDGYLGRCARFASGGQLVFEPQSAFAMTEGLRIDVWLRPTGGQSTMNVLRGEGAYKLQLKRDPKTGGYDVLLTLELVTVGGRRNVGVPTPFKTKGGPIPSDAGWSHLQIAFDGLDASIRINGIEHRARKRKETTETGTGLTGLKRLVVPGGGAVKLVLGDVSSGFTGLMDTLVLGGVFRSSDNERRLVGLKVLRPRLPIRVVYSNGRLDPEVHTTDVVLHLQDEMNPDGALLQFRLGLYGTVDQRLVMGRTR